MAKSFRHCSVTQQRLNLSLQETTWGTYLESLSWYVGMDILLPAKGILCCPVVIIKKKKKKVKYRSDPQSW